MLLFAEISDTVWLALVGVISLAIKEYFDYRRGQDAIKAVAVVKDELRTATDKHDEKIEQIRVATDGLTDRLVAGGVREGYAAGVEQQKKTDKGNP
jgi:hypothetical protein